MLAGVFSLLARVFSMFPRVRCSLMRFVVFTVACIAMITGRRRLPRAVKVDTSRNCDGDGANEPGRRLLDRIAHWYRQPTRDIPGQVTGLSHAVLHVCVRTTANGAPKSYAG